MGGGRVQWDDARWDLHDLVCFGVWLDTIRCGYVLVWELGV